MTMPEVPEPEGLYLIVEGVFWILFALAVLTGSL